MTWLCESPFPIALLGAAFTAALIIGGLKTGSRKLLAGGVVALLVSLGLLVVERLVVTDREQIERIIYSVSQDVRLGRAEAAVEHLVATPPEIRQRALGELRLYKVTEVAIKRPIQIELRPKREPNRATAEFNIVVTGGDAAGMIRDQRVPRFLVVKFVKEDGRWWVEDYEHHDPFYGMRTTADPQ